MVIQTQNQFFLTRAASKPAMRKKSKFLSVDNWIIPFHDAVDLETKLAKWLAVADETLVPAESEDDFDELGPIVVIVEGKTDMLVVKAVASALILRHGLVTINANGKRSLINGLPKYFSALSEAVGFLLLMDADTTDPDQIEEQRAQMAETLSGLDRPTAQVILAAPAIESWLARTPANPKELKELLSDLQQNLFSRAETVPALRDFVHALKSLDAGAG